MLQKEQLGLCPEDFVLPASFLLSMSLLGLEFPFCIYISLHRPVSLTDSKQV